MNWKEGDEFVMVDGDKSNLSSNINGKLFIVEYIKRPPKSIKHNYSEEALPCLWFRLEEKAESLCYAKIDCIRPATKLDKILR